VHISKVDSFILDLMFRPRSMVPSTFTRGSNALVLRRVGCGWTHRLRASFSSEADTSNNSGDEVHDESNTINRTRLGIGGTKLLNPANAEQYAAVIQTALLHNVTTFEASAIGQEGERWLAEAYEVARRRLTPDDSKCPDIKQRPTMMARFGYRNSNIAVGADNDKLSKNDSQFVGDVKLDSQGSGETGAHNISREFVEHCLGESPLAKLRQEQLQASNGNDKAGDGVMELIYMAHNPETQGGDVYDPSQTNAGAPPLEDIREKVRESLTSGFVALEEACRNGTISSYGVSSNGLSLPPSHPLHLGWKDVLLASRDAARSVHGNESVDSKLSTIQLPANLLETRGIKVATAIQSFLTSKKADENDSYTGMPEKVKICISRPLTCYPDQGTGTGYPFKLVDYQIPVGILPNGRKGMAPYEWSHRIPGQPPLYVPALNSAMGHFDAEEILKEQNERDLTVEERETLEGCRLLQSMLHNLDNSLETVRSFQAYEDDLSNKVIPLIHNTFEELDDSSADVLQAFFVMHGAAVRHAVAKTTRKLLIEGGEGVPMYDIPASQKLQDFALQWLLRHEKDIVSQVIIGCPRPEHVMEAINAADSVLLK
jgi:hypothetical protein